MILWKLQPLIFLLLPAAAAQPAPTTPAPQQAPTAVPAASVGAAGTFPSQFLVIGAEYTSKASPHYSGFGAEGWCPATPCKGTYNFNALYLTTNALGRPVTSLVPGIAQHMRAVWRFETYAIAGGGVAMTASGASTGTSITLALNGGILWVFPLGGGKSVDILTQALSAGGSTNFILGLGFGWGR